MQRKVDRILQDARREAGWQSQNVEVKSLDCYDHVTEDHKTSIAGIDCNVLRTNSNSQ